MDNTRTWQRVGDADPLADIDLTVAFKLRNEEVFDKLFWAISTPGNPLFHKYMTDAELNALISPEPAAFELVTSWLADHGIVNYRAPLSKTQVSFRTNVETAERLLSCKFYAFEHPSGQQAISSYGPYSVPANLAPYLTLVAGVTGFPVLPRAQPAPTADTWTVGPANLRQVYSVPASLVATNPKTSQAVAEFQGQFYSPSDLSSFWSTYVNYAPPPKITVVGTNVPAKPGIEASLDIEYITSVGAGANTTFYSYPNFNFWNDLITYTGDVLSESLPPIMHSISYGDQSLSQEPSTTYKAQLDNNFKQLGAKGVTVLISSGDSGCGCQLCTKLSPSYPAGSPYVTAVGATTFSTDVGSTQVAVTAFGSGGGFDWTETPLSYQTAQIAAYFKQSVSFPPASSYNAGGRGTPDVSALGWGFNVVNGGQTLSIGGTSASSPTFAGILSLVNDALLNAGKPTLGFVNPWLYANPSTLTDIVTGNNDHTCCKGWQCSAGWDPVTGLGTPIYTALVASALKQVESL